MHVTTLEVGCGRSIVVATHSLYTGLVLYFSTRPRYTLKVDGPTLLFMRDTRNAERNKNSKNKYVHSMQDQSHIQRLDHVDAILSDSFLLVRIH